MSQAVTAAAPPETALLGARHPMSPAETQLLAGHVGRHRYSLRHVVRMLPWAVGLAGVGLICGIAAWQAGWVGKVLFGAGALFFLWPIPAVFQATPRIGKTLKADLAGGEVLEVVGVLQRRYYTRGRHGHGRIVLDTGADFAVPEALLRAMSEGEALRLRIAPRSACLLSLHWQGEFHVMPSVLAGAAALH